MKRPTFPCILSIITVLSLLIGQLLAAAGVSAQDKDQTETKVNSLLEMRIQAKLEKYSFSIFSQEQSLTPVDLSGDEFTDPNYEYIFIRFHEEPGEFETAELASEGITLYPDCWIPPVGDFKTGVMPAKMPVEKLDFLAGRNYVVGIDTAEARFSPQNDVARSTMNVEEVWNGGYGGEGVTVAVLDSGIDTSNPDFPLLDSTNSKDFSNYPVLDDTIQNLISGHGTHVTGTVLGRGVNSARYKGMAPGADLVFLKIGNDVTSNASYASMAAAILAAVRVYQADIITMSYGGWSQFHDGTDVLCQAVDYAVNRGVTVFMSAGNQALSRHYSGTVAANSTSDFIQVDVNGAGTDDTALFFNLVWFDGCEKSNELVLQYFDENYDPLPDIVSYPQMHSIRGTEQVYSLYDYYLPPGNGTYYLKVQNLSENSQFYHIYDVWGERVSLTEYDTRYTIGSPAEANGAIAVGAYVTRTEWTDYEGNARTNINPQTLGSIATFSSQGPRVDDGAPPKPEIVAPGSRLISVRDNDTYPWPSYKTGVSPDPYDLYIVDNDGLNPDGSGPADYFVMHGTSMACPAAAGVAALMISADKRLSPGQIKYVLERTAVDKGDHGVDSVYGYGLIDAEAAVNLKISHTGIGGEVRPSDKTAVFTCVAVGIILILGLAGLRVGKPY